MSHPRVTSSPTARHRGWFAALAVFIATGLLAVVMPARVAMELRGPVRRATPPDPDSARWVLPDTASMPSPDSARALRPELGPELPPALAPDTTPAGDAALLVRVSWDEDRSPAAGITLRLLQWDQRDPLFHVVEGRTDALGEWRVDNLAPGHIELESDRGGQMFGELIAGQLVELSLELLPGLRVRGEVVDESGRPVPGAGLWLSAQDDDQRGSIVDYADDEGRFDLRGIGAGHRLAARAAGHTASASVAIDARTAARFDLSLRLGPPGGSLRGLVVDAEGQRVPGAAVRLGAAPDGPPLRLLTDAQGEFFVPDVPAGAARLDVRATDSSPWSESVPVLANDLVDVRATLAPQARVSGIVRDARGQPVAGCSISSGHYDELNWCESTSAADGSFELAGLALGATGIRASLHDGARASTTLQLEAGGRSTWDPVLDYGLKLFGRVVNEQSVPLAGYDIEAEPESAAARPRSVTSDETGRFVLEDCDDVPYTVRLWPPERVSAFPLVTATQVSPRGAALDIMVHADAYSTARLTGLLRDAAGRVVRDARLFLRPSRPGPGADEGLGCAGTTDARTGAFRLGPVPPGEYELNIEADGMPYLRLPSIDLLRDQVHDLGVVTYDEPGRLRVRVQLPQGVNPRSIVGALAAQDGRSGCRLALQRDNSLLSPPMPPGDYYVLAWGLHAARVRQPVRIEADSASEVELSLPRCVWHTLCLTPPLREGQPARLNVQIRDARDVVYVDTEARLLEDSDVPECTAPVNICLPPGFYRVLISEGDQTLVDLPLALIDSRTPTMSMYTIP